MLLKTQYFVWVRNSLTNCQKLGNSSGEVPKNRFVFFLPIPEQQLSATIGGVMLGETDFWTIPEQPCLCSWELKERSGVERGSQEFQKTALFMFSEICLLKPLPIHTVKYVLSVSPRQPERVTAPKNQISSILPQRNMAKRSFWINWKSRLQKETFEVPYWVPGRLDFKNPHTMLWVMISQPQSIPGYCWKYRQANKLHGFTLSIMASVRLLLDVISACRAVSHAQCQASSAEEGFGCKLPVLQSVSYWKTIKTKHLAPWALHSAGTLRLSVQDLWVG